MLLSASENDHELMNIHKDFGSHRSMEALIARSIGAINAKTSGDGMTVHFYEPGPSYHNLNLGKVPGFTYSLRVTI